MKRIYRLLFVLVVLSFCSVAIADESAYDDDEYQDEDEAFDSKDDELTVETAEEILKEHQEKAQIDQIDQRLVGLMEQSSEIQSLQQNLLERTEALRDLIRQVNTIQLNSLVSQLNQTVEREIRQRAEGKQKETGQTSNENEQEGVPLRELEETLSPSRILEDSDKQLEAWIMSLIKEEVVRQRREASHNPEASCATPVEAVEKVQESLTKHQMDGVGRMDLARDATIVYEHTSDTYIPPVNPEHKIGNASWRRYIPLDWERILPTGWEDWAVPSLSVPQSLGIKGGGLASAEQILNPNTNVGSCWPIPGRKGQVLLRLPRPIKVDAVTLDHVSQLLLEDDAISSAPRHVKVVGYPPCDEVRCKGMGFDMEDPFEVVSFEYKIDEESSSIQTFQVSGESEGGAECSVTAASCSAPPDDIADSFSYEDDVVGGILVQILDNWGNEDYTCIYRFRLHGDEA